jgi:hypothetical protein
MDFVQVFVFLSIFATGASTLGVMLGIFEYQKKAAFSAL